LSLLLFTLSNNPSKSRLFGYKEEWRDRAQWNSGNHRQKSWNGANTRPETEL